MGRYVGRSGWADSGGTVGVETKRPCWKLGQGAGEKALVERNQRVWGDPGWRHGTGGADSVSGRERGHKAGGILVSAGFERGSGGV